MQLQGKVLLNSKGSTMILILLVLTMLSILGTALLSLAGMNFQMTLLEGKEKKAFYLSEAGIEEAYALICEEVEKASEYGKTYADLRLKQLLEEEIARENTPPYEYKSEYFIEGRINESKINARLDSWFREGYMLYMNSSLAPDRPGALSLPRPIANVLTDSDSYTRLDPTIQSSKPVVTINEVKLFDSGDNPDISTITLTSLFNYDGVPKEIRSVLEINIPGRYNKPIRMETKVVELRENVLWKKLITAEGNIIVSGSSKSGDIPNHIFGDVYAYGTKPADTNLSKEYGGIIAGLGEDAGKIEIVGDIVTNSYVHINGDGSHIRHRNGQIFCNSLVIQAGTTDGIIEVLNGNVYTLDDIELNGTRSVINIEGSYYAFSEGSDTGVDKTHDKSSSLVINSPDIGSGSSIRISGTGVDGSPYKPGIMLAGTAYINAYRSDDTEKQYPYQTGESVAIKGNYIAYDLSHKEWWDKLHEKTGDARYAGSNILFHGYDRFWFADEFVSLFTSIPVSPPYTIMVTDKSQYIANYYNSNPEVLTGGGMGIDIRNVFFSTGAYIELVDAGGSLKPRFSSSKPYMEGLSLINRIVNEYNYRLNKLADPAITYIDSTTLNPAYFHTNREYILDSSKQKGRFRFTDELYRVKKGTYGNIDQLIYVNESKGLAIIGPGGSIRDLSGTDGSDTDFEGGLTGEDGTFSDDQVQILDLRDQSEVNLNGIIVTGGNVYLRGRINFTGNIVTLGNVYIQDSNEKNLYQNENIVKKIMYENPELYSMYVNSSPVPSTFVYFAGISGSDANSYIPSNTSMVKLKSWKMIH